MRKVMGPIVCLCLAVLQAHAGQVIAGSAEEKSFQKVSSETNPELKLQLIGDFEKQYPRSRVMTNVYLMAIDLYREKSDRTRIIEYGEKVLALDQNNLTAMMVLARNYAIEGKDKDRAVELAQRAYDRVAAMKSGPMPAHYTEVQWKSYIDGSEAAARTILDYTKSIRGR